jgi:hypothetical protein
VILIIGLIFGVFLIVRAVVEPFAIDVTDPSTYRSDWGGPSLVGVLLVHCGPGVLAAIAIIIVVRNRLRATRSDAPTAGSPDGDRRR